MLGFAMTALKYLVPSKPWYLHSFDSSLPLLSFLNQFGLLLKKLEKKPPSHQSKRTSGPESKVLR